MKHIIENEGKKETRFYNRQDGNAITANHLSREIKGMLSIADCWSTQESLEGFGTVREAMSLGLFQDVCRAYNIS
jgi:hypothetical protein